MFETLVTGVLTNVMGSFIDPKCFSSENITMAVWSGYVVLRDLELKPEVIAHPSINLVRGVVGSVELKIPWNRLQSESVVVTVDDVYLLVRTEEDIEGVLMDMDEFTIKKQLLEQLYEEAKKKQEAEQKQNPSAPKDDGFAARLVNKIIDNIELHVRRIHVRLEDHVTGDHPFSVGLTVESVHAQSTNSNWQPSYVDSSKNSEPRIYKMVELNHLSVYLDPHCDVLRNQRIDFKNCPLEDFCHAFNHSIPKRFDDRHPLQLYPTHQRHHFILKPVDASARLIVNRDPFDTSIPKFEIDVSIAEIGIRLEDSQYCDLLYLASAFQIPEHHKKFQQYRKFRPRRAVSEESASEWWKYAITAIMDDNRKKKVRWSWKYMKERRDDRARYKQLWERYMRQLEMGPNRVSLADESDDDDAEDEVNSRPHEVTKRGSDRSSVHSSLGSGANRNAPLSGRARADMIALETIERKRPIEDILFFRYLADNKMREDNESRVQTTEGQTHHQVPMPPFSDSESVDTDVTEPSVPTEMRYRSWGKWMFGWTSQIGAAPSLSDSSAVPKRGFPEVELRELFKIVEYEPAKRAKRRNRSTDPSNGSSNLDHEEDEEGVDELESRITLSLGKGSITLSSDPDANKRLARDDPNYGSRYAPTDFLLGSFTHLQVAAITKGESTKVDVSLQTIDAFDESADSMAFSRLLTRKHDRALSASEDDGGIMSVNRMSGPIFLMSYETNPVGVAADAALYVHMEPLEIVFSPTARCWGRLGSFMSTPQVLGLWAELEVASLNDIVNLKARTEAKLNYVMANRVALSMDLRIQAPLIVIPESDTDYNCARMVVDLGHINFRTDRLSKLDGETASLSASTTGGFSMASGPPSLALSSSYSSPQLTSSMSFVRQLYDDAEKGEGTIRWKEEFYDKFTLSVTNVHVLLIPHGKSMSSGSFLKNGVPLPTSYALNGNSPSPDWELIERFSINVTLRTSVLPLDATLTRLYVHADLPALTFNMSLEKYFQLIALVERFGAAADLQVSPDDSKKTSASLASTFLDSEGTFNPDRRENFLSVSALKKFTEDDKPRNNKKMELDELLGGDKSDSDGLSDADSDDTWFSITSGNIDLPFSSAEGLNGLSTSDLDGFSLGSGALNEASNLGVGTRAPGARVPNPTREKKRGRRGSLTLPSGDLIDRRLFVCTFTVPVISIQLKKPQNVSMPPPTSFRYDSSGIFDDDIPESGTLLLKLEGFRVRIAKKTLSTQVELCFRSLDVEDFVDVGGRSSEYLMFSCPSITAPYKLTAPPRRSLPYAGGGTSRRRVSRQRERVISFQRTDTNSAPVTTSNLLELVFSSTSDRQTCEESSRDLNVRVGAVHLVFDQAYVCSLLELFEETWSKVSGKVSVPIALEDDGDDDFLDAIPPPLDLTPSVTQEFSLPVTLTESVLADLERARKDFLAQEKSFEREMAARHELLPVVTFTIGIQLQSVSVLFCDRGDAVASAAVVGIKIQASTGAEDGESVNIRAGIKDVRIFDLAASKDSILVQERPGGHSFRKPYVEVFGLERHHQTPGGGKILTIDAVFNKTSETGESSSSNEKRPKASVSVAVQATQLQVQSAFIENLVNYAVHGAIATWLVAKEDGSTTTKGRRKGRAESFASENTGTPTHRASIPDINMSQRSSPTSRTEDEHLSMPTRSADGGSPEHDSFLENCEISIELLHPSILIPCGSGYSESDEALIIDLGVIKVQAGVIGSSSAPDSASPIKPIVSVAVDGAQVFTRSEKLKILDESTIRVDFGSVERPKDASDRIPLDQVLTIAVSPLKLNVGEKYLCLALDLWNDVVNPTIQVFEGISRSPLAMKASKPDVESAVNDEVPSRGMIIDLRVASLQLVMVSKPLPEFDMWLKATMDAPEAQSGRDINTSGTPGSPRRRRHNFSFAQDDQNNFKSVTPTPSIIPVAELVLSNMVVSLKARKVQGESGNGEQTVEGFLSVQEICVRDVVADPSEFMCEVLCRVPQTPSQQKSDPQVKVEIALVQRQMPGMGESNTEITVGAKISSARVCILPRTLLRIENFFVGVALSLGQKLAEQDPRIVSSAEQHSSALAVSDVVTASHTDDLSISQDRILGYGPSSVVRGRKNSIAESLLESSRATRRDDLVETSAMNVDETSHPSTRIVWKARADLANLQLWLLSSDRQRDSFGLCLSSRFVLVVEQPAARVVSGSTDSISECLLLSSSAKAADVRVYLGSPLDPTAQCFELIEQFTSVFDLSVTQYERGLENDKDCEVTDAKLTDPSPPWKAWKVLKSSIAVSSITSRLSYKDLPVIMRIATAVSTVASAESHVRLPLASLSANDPYADLVELDSDDGDQLLQDQVASEHIQLPQIIRVSYEMGSISFRLINNLVDEDSPVVGFRVGPLHLHLHDEAGSKTTIDGSCSLEAWYHNLRLVASEPLIEPWNVTLHCTQDRSHQRFSSTSGGMNPDGDSIQTPWKVAISSTEFLQWNVTDALVTNIMAASRAWEWMNSGGAVDSSDRSEYSTYWIRNETGLVLRYWGPSCRDNVMAPGAEEPLLFAPRPRSKSGEYPYGDPESDRFIGRQIFIAVEDGRENAKVDNDDELEGRIRRWESEFSIPVDQADSRMYALVDLDSDMSSSRVRKCECVIDVLVERGCKVFVVRSTLVLENNTASDLEVEYVPPLRRTASPPFRPGTPRGHLIPSWKAVVGSSASIPVPINLVSATDGYLMVRPPDMKSSNDGLLVQLPKAYAKKRVHLPLFDRALPPATDNSISDEGITALSGEPQCGIKFHRLYGDRPVRPFMMSATLAVANNSLYQRKVAFQPPLVIHNLTAGPLEYCIATPNDWTPATDGVNNQSTSVNLGWEDCQQRLRERGTIDIADSLVWHLCDWDTPLELQIRMKGFEWSEPLRLVEDLPEDVYRIRMADLSSNAHLFISAETQTVRGRCREVSLFVPYWIVNLTGLKLEYEHDDERAAYEHSTMLLAGQKRLDRDELLLKEEQNRSSRHAVHSHLVHPLVFPGGTNKVDTDDESGATDQFSSHQPEEQRRRHPGLIPSIPPIKGLLDLLPKPVEDVRVVGQLEVLQACHSSSQPERGCIRVRVNEVDRRMGNNISDGRQKHWTESIVLDQPGTSGELEATDYSLDRVYSIGYSISTAKARYSRTKVIMLTPRFMIINTMSAPIEVCHSSPRSSPGIDDQGSGGGVVSALNPALRLDPGGYADFHWSLPFAKSKTIRCRLAEAGWSWSGAVPLGESREYVVRMRNDSTRATRLVRVVLKLDGPCVCVYLREESSSAPPYRIENYSLETFRIHQHSVRRSEILLPHHSLDYAWDEPTQDRVLVVDMLPSAAGDNSRPLRIGSFILDKIHRFPDGLGGTLGIEITADGPTRVLRFTDTRIRAAGAIDATGNASLSEARDHRALQTFPSRFLSRTAFELRLQLQGVGLSIVDGSPRELIYVSFAGLSLEVFVSDGDDDPGRFTGTVMSRAAKEQQPKVVALRFQMRDFQIDNQLAVTPYPVLLRFSNPGSRTRIVDGKVENVPVVDVCLVKHDGYAGIEFIRHFNLRVLPLHIRVDGSLLYQLLPVFVHTKMSSIREPSTGTSKSWDSSRFKHTTLLMEEYNASLEVGVEILDVMREDGTTSILASSSTMTDRENVHSQHENLSSANRPSFTVSTHANHHGRLVSKAEAKKLYFEEFHIDPIRATVSFSFGASAGAMVDGLNSWADSGRNSPITVGPLRLIINAIGTSLAKIANAPFHLKAISIGHSFIQPDALASRLVSHYQSEALRQAYVILGSVDVFGNPMVAWRNMKGGFQDFINEPVHGISKSPTEFALGMGRGTYSLIRASVYTFLDFNARILAASSLGLSEACLKLDEYTGYPATRNIYQGFAQGISGIVVSPIRAVELNGVRGVLPGVFAGVFGFVLKPMLGVSLAAATTVASLRDAIDPNTKALLMRARPPRHIDLRTRRLKVYSYVESFGEEMVGKLRGGRYRSDGYVGHIDLKQKCFLVTRKRILYIDVKAGQKYEVVWELHADELVLVEWQSANDDSSIALYYIEEDYTPRRRAALAVKGMLMSKHIVPLPENRVLFVRAMLQQQERSLFVEEPHHNNPTTAILPSSLTQRTRSMDQLTAYQQRFPSEYPIFKFPALTATKSMANVQPPLASGPPTTTLPAPAPVDHDSSEERGLDHGISQIDEEDSSSDDLVEGDDEDHVDDHD